MGERKEDRQQTAFVSTSELRSAGHTFYQAVSSALSGSTVTEMVR